MSKPGSLSHFHKWSKNLVLDTGETWEIEDWQLEVVEEIVNGVPITWNVVPEGNGKTTLSAGIGLYQLDPLGWGMATPMVVVAASTSKQAEWMYVQAAGFVQRTPSLAASLRCLGGFKRIERVDDKLARMDVFAGDDKAADGAIFTLAFVDELHRHKDLRLYRIWRGKLQKRDGQMLITSTAGEPSSEFEDSREAIIKTADKIERWGDFDSHIRAESGKVVLHDWAVRSRAAAHQTEVVLEANPFSTVSASDIEEKRDDPTTTWDHFLRFSCNIATRVEGQAITGDEFDALKQDPFKPEGDWVCGWLDLGWKIDTTALGMLRWHSTEKRFIEDVLILEPPVDESNVVAGLLAREEAYEPVGWVFDDSAGGQQMAQLLEKGEHPLQTDDDLREAAGLPRLEGRPSPRPTFINHSQDNAPMSRAATRLEEAIRKRWLHHDGNKTLKKHFLNAVKKSLGGEKWKYDRPKEARGRARARFPIDALTGVLMGNSVAVDENQNPKKKGAHFFV